MLEMNTLTSTTHRQQALLSLYPQPRHNYFCSRTKKGMMVFRSWFPLLFRPQQFLFFQSSLVHFIPPFISLLFAVGGCCNVNPFPRISHMWLISCSSSWSEHTHHRAATGGGRHDDMVEVIYKKAGLSFFTVDIIRSKEQKPQHTHAQNDAELLLCLLSCSSSDYYW